MRSRVECVRKEHDVLMVCIWIDRILRPANIIGGIMDLHQMVSVDLIIFEQNLSQLQCEILQPTLDARAATCVVGNQPLLLDPPSGVD